MYYFYSFVVNFDVVYCFCAVVEKNFFVDFDNFKIYFENCNVIYCDTYQSLIFYLKKIVICYFDIVFFCCLNNFCFNCMRNF